MLADLSKFTGEILMKLRSRLIAIALAVQTAGCSAFVPWEQHVSITASDPQAQVMIDNQIVGTGHVETDLPRDRSYSIVATAHGQTAVATIDHHISTTGILDIVGTFFFIVPIIGVFTPGFWDLDPTNVHIVIPAGNPAPGFSR